MLKRSLLAACGAATLFAAAACNDGAYLTEQPYSFVGPTNFYRNAGDALAAVTGVYASFIQTSGDGYYGRNFVMLVEYPTEALTTYLSATNERSLPDNYNLSPSHAYIYSTWTGAYAAINRANAVIAHVPGIDMDTTLRARIVGEAKFLRALHYFNLVRLFGDVPLTTQETTSPSTDQLQQPRTPAANVYQQIIADLQDAAAVLPVSYTGADIGRATSGAAKSLLAKVYMQRVGTGIGTPADWQSALDLLDQVKATGVYSLVPTYSWLFDMAHETNSEVIFDIQNSHGVGGRLSSYVAPRNSNYGSSQNGAFEAELPFFNEYTLADKRRPVTWQLSFTNKSNKTVNWDSTQTAKTAYGADSPYPAKFLDKTSTGGGDDAANYIILRYADNLLMEAEAINEISGPTTAAYAAINQVRARAGTGDLTPGLSQQAFRDSVFHERRLELVLEGPNGYFDSQRNWAWAKARVQANMALGAATSFKTSKYPKAQNTLDDHFRLMPIPQQAIDLNPKLTQNPGW